MHQGAIDTKIQNPVPGSGIQFFYFFVNFQIGIDTKFGGGCQNFWRKKMEVGIDTYFHVLFSHFWHF